MPIAKVQLPDGRIGRFEVPDGTTPEQVLEFASKGLSSTPQQTDAQIATNTSLPTKQRWEAYVRADKEAAANGAYNLGGKVTDITGSPLLGTIARVLPDALQMMTAANISGEVAKPVVEAGAKSLMHSAIKPGGTTASQIAKGNAAVQTALENPGFNPSQGGVETVKKFISDRASQVAQDIANSGATVDPRAVADYVPQAYGKFAARPNAVQAVEDLGNVQTNFLNHPMVNGAREIPIQTAQELKQGFQSAIGDRGYGELKTPITEGEKAIARGLREIIAQKAPSVAKPLGEEASAINSLKFLARRAAVEANKNPLGLGALVSQPWMLPVWLWDRSALAKAIVARNLYQNASSIPALLGVGGAALYNAGQQQK